ncbi:hypothetical protein EX30DRAFT_111726 [Ascodesmis nigricans]|uniref:Uncharacterized protein n=1 Tax=Ascodesmis nigricans TaxID=341454 RepID=A0A4S2MQ52_9PEZI|nr:hypothetical protein EX30DRAFT_111726 [Ascodesmis nigricans]
MGSYSMGMISHCLHCRSLIVCFNGRFWIALVTIHSILTLIFHPFERESAPQHAQSPTSGRAPPTHLTHPSSSPEEFLPHRHDIGVSGPLPQWEEPPQWEDLRDRR